MTNLTIREKYQEKMNITVTDTTLSDLKNLMNGDTSITIMIIYTNGTSALETYKKKEDLDTLSLDNVSSMMVTINRDITVPVSICPYTEVNYGKAIADVIRPFIKKNQAAKFYVLDESGDTIQEFSVISKAGTSFVHEDSAPVLPFKAETDVLPEKYMIYVNANHNNNKFYRMVDLKDGTWGAYYGRVGTEQGESCYSTHVSVPHVYPMYMYYIKLYEKVEKGYTDVSNLHKKMDEIVMVKHNFAGISDALVASLVKQLTNYAQAKIKDSYTVKSEDVTEEMIKEAEKVIDKLANVKTVRTFNKYLLELFKIIPRRMNGVNAVANNMAKTDADFQNIINREDSLLSVMKTAVKMDSKKKNLTKDDEQNVLEAMGLEIYPATDKQKNSVLAHLGDSLKPKVKQVYRVINKKTQKRFDAWLDTHRDTNGRKPVVKQFWHGSRNENWWSIVTNGLALNPNRFRSNVVITGKMFGNGLYFAPSSAKSFNYTSFRGTSWAGGTANTAFMALYATAYGTPYEVFSWNGNWAGYNYSRLQNDCKGAGCVHAKADKGMLRNDEVIFYNEDQTTINYIVEFGD